jgi:hypothetical protein
LTPHGIARGKETDDIADFSSLQKGTWYEEMDMGSSRGDIDHPGSIGAVSAICAVGFFKLGKKIMIA